MVAGEWPQDTTASVPRPELHAVLVNLMRPKGPVSLYAVVSGDAGTGKSTAIHDVAREMGRDGVNGVAYVALRDVATSAVDVAAAIGFDSLRVNLNEWSWRLREASRSRRSGTTSTMCSWKQHVSSWRAMAVRRR